MTTLAEPVTFYLVCPACDHRWESHWRVSCCTICGEVGRVYGLREDRWPTQEYPEDRPS